MVLCGILTKEATKILGVHTSYNKKLWDDLNFRDSIKNISNVIRLHEWKFITLQYIKKYVIFKIPNIILGLFPFFYKNFLGGWGEYYYQATTVPSAVGSQYLWFSNRVNIHSKVIYFRGFSDKKAIFKKIS